MSEAASIHPAAICASPHLGPGCVIGPLSFIAASARLGARVRVGSHATLPDDLVLGDDCQVGDGARLSPGLEAEPEVRIGANAVFLPGAEREPGVRLGPGATIGANATVHAGVCVGRGAVVEDGAVVRRDVQPYAIVSGNPAVVVGFAGADTLPPVSERPALPEVFPSKVRGVSTYRLPVIFDPRGSLSVGEFEKTLPFRPRRFFMTFDVPSAHVRGEHAHRECHQFLLCVRGACSVVVDDGAHREEYRLDSPVYGVHVPPMVWAAEYKHSADSVLVVFASHHYEPADYIRDYGTFLEEIRRGPA